MRALKSVERGQNVTIHPRMVAVLSRARTLNMPLARICELAGIMRPNRTTIARWAQGRVDPPISVFERTMERIEEWLEAKEAELRKALGGWEDAA